MYWGVELYQIVGFRGFILWVKKEERIKPLT